MFAIHRYHVQHAIKSIRPFLELPEGATADPQTVRCHRRILRWGAVTAAATSVAWTALLLIGLLGGGQLQGDWSDLKLLVVAALLPIGLFLPGTFVGVCFALAFAPAKFLNGAAGHRWLKLIGTKNLAIGRVVCTIGGIGTSPLILVPATGVVGILLFAKAGVGQAG